MYSECYVEITQADYNELNSEDSRWTLREYAYWAAKFRSGFPAEGYGIYRPHTEIVENRYRIVWEHMDNCD